jgi:hypothetical protein
MPLGKKTRSVQYLGAIREEAAPLPARLGIGFVDHALLKRLGLSQSVFEGRRCGVPT